MRFVVSKIRSLRPVVRMDELKLFSFDPDIDVSPRNKPEEHGRYMGLRYGKLPFANQVLYLASNNVFLTWRCNMGPKNTELRYLETPL